MEYARLLVLALAIRIEIPTGTFRWSFRLAMHYTLIDTVQGTLLRQRCIIHKRP